MGIDFGSLEYNTIMYCTIAIIVFKAILSLYMAKKISQRRKEGVTTGLDFIQSIFVLVACLCIGRIFFAIFDFHYTQLNQIYYTEPMSVLFWKIAVAIATLGQAFLLFTVDRKIMQNKLKGIPALIMVIGTIVVCVYPVRQGVFEDFTIISTILALISLAMLYLFAIFIFIAKKSSGDIRKTALTFIFGFAIYMIAALMVNASVIESLTNLIGQPVEVAMYLIQTIMKMVGMFLLARGATKFSL